MLYAMDNKAIELGIPVHERKEAIALIHEDGVCYGAIVRDLVTGELIAYVARATTIATGGYGRLYSVTTNAVISEGIGNAIALETGVACLGNMEAVQFHPTANRACWYSHHRRLPWGRWTFALTRTATGSCPTTSPAKKSWPPGTLFPGA